MSDDRDEITPTRPKMDWWWYAPEYFSRWRLFPRAFISMYIYLLYRVVEWFMALPDPNMNQAGLVSVVVGAGAAWFGLYVNSVGSNKESVSPLVRVSETQTTTTRTVEPVNPDPEPQTSAAKPRRATSNKFDIK